MFISPPITEFVKVRRAVSIVTICVLKLRVADDAVEVDRSATCISFRLGRVYGIYCRSLYTNTIFVSKMGAIPSPSGTATASAVPAPPKPLESRTCFRGISARCHTSQRGRMDNHSPKRIRCTDVMTKPLRTSFLQRSRHRCAQLRLRPYKNVVSLSVDNKT